MQWTSRSLNLQGQQTLYVAIKPQNASLMRQIAIPLGSANGSARLPPSPPSNLRIIQ
jgi:hypothetical protein